LVTTIEEELEAIVMNSSYWLFNHK